MSDEMFYKDFSDEHKAIAIEIQNKLIGLSVKKAGDILYKVGQAIEIDSSVKEFNVSSND